ncbi:MAG: PrgI family protein [Candidatus Gracilibacteria bacterium]|nr:PrgI family protein [Candidatus Gracilibacteria bacterium]MDQ7023253.1 PrgI family protein [Candidatus Gracilibacteria bacterium]
MQYKIPVQIENEDPIFLGLGLKQLAVIMVGGGIAFQVFDGLRGLGNEIAAIPALLIFGLTVLIAVFKHYEMTFIPFIFAILRRVLNGTQRRWVKGVDSFEPMHIGYIKSSADKKESVINFESKLDKLQNLEDKINKI